MKKVMKYVVMIVAILSTIVNYASTTEDYVQPLAPTAESAHSSNNPIVIIRNKKGQAVYEVAYSTSSSKVELVSNINLPKGNYTYELVDETSVEIISFEVAEDSILFDANGSKMVFKPTVRIKDDLVLVSQLSLQKEPLKIKMYYSEQSNEATEFELIYSEKIGKEMILERIYDLDKSQVGSYKIEFTSNGKVFTETFTL